MYCYYKGSVALPHGAWVGLQCVIVVFPDHTHLLLIIANIEGIILVNYFILVIAFGPFQVHDSKASTCT